MEKLHEECAVFGVSLKPETDREEAAGICYNGLLAMQHRGQEGAGIAVVRKNAIICHKDVGLVTEAFPPRVMEQLPSARQAIGHARYSTTGSNTARNVQPFVTEFLTGRIATAHNGNVVNAKEIREKLTPTGRLSRRPVRRCSVCSGCWSTKPYPARSSKAPTEFLCRGICSASKI